MSGFVVGLAAGLVGFYLVLFTWYAYNCGYHQGWLDHSDGRINYTARRFLDSLDRGSHRMLTLDQMRR